MPDAVFEILMIPMGIIMCINLFLFLAFPIYVYFYVKRNINFKKTQKEIKPKRLNFLLYVILAVCFPIVFFVPINTTKLEMMEPSLSSNYVLFTLIETSMIIPFVIGPVLFILQSLEERKFSKFRELNQEG